MDDTKNVVILRFRDGSTRPISLTEATDLQKQIEAALARFDFLIDMLYLAGVLNEHGHGRNTGGLWGSMTYPGKSPFTTFSKHGDPVTITTRQSAQFAWLSARDILRKQGEFTNGSPYQFGTVNRTCFNFLVEALTEHLKALGTPRAPSRPL